MIERLDDIDRYGLREPHVPDLHILEEQRIEGARVRIGQVISVGEQGEHLAVLGHEFFVELLVVVLDRCLESSRSGIGCGEYLLPQLALGPNLFAQSGERRIELRQLSFEISEAALLGILPDTEVINDSRANEDAEERTESVPI